jgi:hypothetical protein
VPSLFADRRVAGKILEQRLLHCVVGARLNALVSKAGKVRTMKLTPWRVMG